MLMMKFDAFCSIRKRVERNGILFVVRELLVALTLRRAGVDGRETSLVGNSGAGGGYIYIYTKTIYRMLGIYPNINLIGVVIYRNGFYEVCFFRGFTTTCKSLCNFIFSGLVLRLKISQCIPQKKKR